MLIIRLARRGRRNDPSFKLVVTEHANPVKGKFLEELGYLNPKTKAKAFEKERILYWISKGAKCSPTVNNLLISEKIIEGEKVKAWRPKKKEGQEAPKAEAKKAEPRSEQSSATGEKSAEAESSKQDEAEEKAPEASPEPQEPAIEKAEERKEEKIEPSHGLTSLNL